MEWRRWIYALPARLRVLLHSRQSEQDLHDELAFHVAMQERANQERGMADVEAYRRARLAVGGVEQAKEACRDARPLRWADDFAQDLRYAWRSLRHAPAFTVVAVLTLALGIGANTAMFSVLNTFLFRALPYPESERLVEVFRTSIYSQSWPHSAPNFLDFQARNEVFEHFAAFTATTASFAVEGEPSETLRPMSVAADFFPALGVRPQVGRWFTQENDQPGANLVAVLSHQFWQSRFAGDPDIVGRTVRIDGEPVEILGVMPQGFEHPVLWGHVDLWRPLAFTPEQRQARGNNYLRAFARLKPGVSLDAADQAMATLAANLSKETSSNQNESLRLAPLQKSMSDDLSRRVMWFTFGLAGFVLLIACVNLANLQLVRAAARVREHTVRAALGARRLRLIRQSLTESIAIAALGGGLSLLLATAGAEFIGRRLFTELPGARVALDFSVFAFALACTAITSIAFGIVPAWFTARTDVNQALKESPRGSTGGSHHRMLHLLIVGEVAFALVLLAGAGLFLRGLQRFANQDPGWRVDGLLTAQLPLRGVDYDTPAKRLALYRNLEERLRTVPGVQHVALSASMPIWGFNSSGDARIEGQPEPEPGRAPEVFFEPATVSYFDTYGIRLLDGRLFTPSDTADSPPVVIINEAMARHFWSNESAVGKRIGRPRTDAWWEVVGVVNDVAFPGSLNEPRTRFQAFRPLAQATTPGIHITLRTNTPPEGSANDLRRAVAELAPTLTPHRIRTARSLVDQGMGNMSLLATLLGAFAALGLTLAAIGIYGVTSYSVVQRTGEFGLRAALGAQARDVLALVMSSGAALVFAGVVLGSVGAYSVARLLSSAIPTLPTRDPLALVGMTLTLAAIALLACYLPARRATKVDPLVALRHE